MPLDGSNFESVEHLISIGCEAGTLRGKGYQFGRTYPAQARRRLPADFYGPNGSRALIQSTAVTRGRLAPHPLQPLLGRIPVEILLYLRLTACRRDGSGQSRQVCHHPLVMPTMNFPSVARRSGCIQQIGWLALNIADWKINTKPQSAPGRNAERR